MDLALLKEHWIVNVNGTILCANETLNHSLLRLVLWDILTILFYLVLNCLVHSNWVDNQFTLLMIQVFCALLEEVFNKYIATSPDEAEQSRIDSLWRWSI